MYPQVVNTRAGVFQLGDFISFIQLCARPYSLVISLSTAYCQWIKICGTTYSV